MRVLLTGSSGFIGSQLTKRLENAGCHVVGVDRTPPDGREPADFVHGDLLEDGVLERAFEGIDCVFHLAAAKDDWGISRQEYFRDNVRATKRLLSVGAGHGVDRWFHYSTVGVLPPGPEAIDEGATRSPRTNYGASKARAEELFEGFVGEHPNAKVTILRPSAVFGPENPPTTNVHRLIEAILDGRFVMVGDGDTLKTTSYIENLLAASTFLMDRMETGLHVFHYVDEPVMTTDILVDRIYGKLSRDRPGWRIPVTLAKSVAYVSDLAAAVMGVDLPITGARIEKFDTPTNFDASAIRRLGFRQPVSNETAVARTVDWHLDRRKD